MPEWYLLVSALAALSGLGTMGKSPALGTSLLATLPLLLLAVALSVAHALSHAANAQFPTRLTTRRARYLRVGLTAFLVLLQPLARLNGRLSAGLTIWRRHGAPGGRQRSDVPLLRSAVRALRLRRDCLRLLWSERWYSAETWLRALESALRAHGAVVRRGEDFDRWDLEIRTGTFTALRLLMAIEEHGRGRQLVRFRMWPSIAGPLLWLSLLDGAMAVGAAAVGAWLAALILGGIMAMLVMRAMGETGGTIYSVLRALHALEPATVASPAEVTLLEEGGRDSQELAAPALDHAPEMEILVKHNGHTRWARVEFVALRSEQDPLRRPADANEIGKRDRTKD
jgi:hypothetical protein